MTGAEPDTCLKPEDDGTKDSPGEVPGRLASNDRTAYPPSLPGHEVSTMAPQFAEGPVEDLTLEECWELLGVEEFGRLAYRLVDEVHIVPINYLVDGRSLLFRTASGNKLLAAALHSDVAFEIDWHDTETAWSVVARGNLRRLEEDEQARADALPGRPWVDTPKYDVVELTPEVVTGKRFRLDLGQVPANA
jgi:nitroimidazol reductase NimA-like FMN-containing flavoprotein (pyridoxamine 5'-phosphate oxidase superfamily)